MNTTSTAPKRRRPRGRDRLWLEIQSYLEFWAIAVAPL
jgi:hypothetical protein